MPKHSVLVCVNNKTNADFYALRTLRRTGCGPEKNGPDRWERSSQEPPDKQRKDAPHRPHPKDATAYRVWALNKP